MSSHNEQDYSSSVVLESQDADQFSFLLGLKEFAFLTFIFFFGFTGFSFCVKKINSQTDSEKVEDIIVHDIEVASAHVDKSTLETP